MKISPARAAAFDILLRVETTDAYASELLHSSHLARLSPADRGLATEIVMGVLRWRSELDDQIAAHIPQPLTKLDAEVITALRIGGYQLLFLDRIPAHAAINDSVELVKKARKRSAAGMVNAVLRKIKPANSAAKAAESAAPISARLEDGPSREHSDHIPALSSRAHVSTRPALSSRAQQDLSLAKDPAKSRDLLLAAPGDQKERIRSHRLSHNPDRETGNQPPASKSRSPFDSRPPAGRSGQALDSGNRFASESISAARDDSAVRSHPEWLVNKWTRNYGSEASQQICEYDQQHPSTGIRVNDPALAEELAQEGIELEPGRILSSARIVLRGDVTRSKAFRERRLVIQDEGSQLVALLLGQGQSILDCCAAPGGKTRIIAEQNPHERVLAVELHPHRATLLKRLVSLPNVDVVVADSRSMPFAGTFDRILVDAPCTGTGTLARNPEIKWRLTPEDIERLQAYQLEILKAAMQQLSPLGQLLYSTCSLEPEENEAVIDQALSGSGFRILDIRARLTELREAGMLAGKDTSTLTTGPYLRTLPGVHPCDGFFAALLEREL